MIKVLAIGLFIVLLVLLGPFITIWSLNTLFGLGIDYTLWTWLSVIILGSFFNSGRIGQKSS
jgi:hypothetical protein